MVSGSLDTSIRVWDVESGACRHALMGHQVKKMCHWIPVTGTMF